MSMKAVVVRRPGDPSVLIVETVPDPEPKGSELLVKVHACGVCYHDVVARNGTLKRGIRMPLIPGHEVAGEVVAVGDHVRRIRVGDRVAASWYHVCSQCKYCRSGREVMCPEGQLLGDGGLNGGYAEYVLIEEETAALIPEGVSMEEASLAPCAVGTELNAIRDVARVRAGEYVLVTGAGGGVGIHGVQIAKLAGGIVICTTTSPEKVAALEAAGADIVLRIEKGEDFSKKVRDATGGAGVDAVIDNVGTAVFQSVLRSLAPGGRWVLVGQLSGTFVPFNPAQLFLRGVSLLPAVNATRQQIADALDLIRRKRIVPHIAGVYSLEEVPLVHARIERGEVLGRAILKPAR